MKVGDFVVCLKCKTELGCIGCKGIIKKVGSVIFEFEPINKYCKVDKDFVHRVCTGFCDGDEIWEVIGKLPSHNIGKSYS